MKRTVLATSLAACLVPTVLVGAAVVASPALAASRKPVVIDCQGKGVAKPKQIVLSCADANVAVTGLSWSSWTANAAKGSGTLSWNPCIPTCVAGKAETFPVKVTLGRLASGAGLDVFSGMTLAYPKGGPTGEKTSTYLLDNPAR